MSRKTRSAALVLALTVLFVSSAYAAPRATAPAKRAPGFFTVAWGWFASLGSTEAPGIQEKAGSQMDPNGATVYDILLSNLTDTNDHPIGLNGNK